MMPTFDVVAGAVAVIITVWMLIRWNKRRRMPPGPRGLPFLGNILQMNLKSPLPDLVKWRGQYGDVYTITLAGKDTVVVSSLDLIKEVLLNKQDVFSGRPSRLLINAMVRFHGDVAMESPSPSWRLKKKVMITSLKMYGEELSKLEKVTLKCIKDTLKTIENSQGKPFNPRHCIHLLLEQIMAILVSGSPMSDDDTESLMEAQEFVQTTIFAQRAPELQWFPWLRHVGHPVYNETLRIVEIMWRIYGAMISDRKTKFDMNNPECVIDGFLLHQANEKSANDTPILNDEILTTFVIDIFEAGIVTTLRNTLAMIAVLTNKPEVQEKVHKEIDQVLGNRDPSLQDRHEMHYTSACIYEELRYASGNPVLVPHMASEDGLLGSYLVPKGTQIWCFVWEVNHDPTYWEDPWEFKPERFLDEQGHLVAPDHPNRRRLLSFGAGRRVCAGEVLAKNRIFLLIASLFQKFTFTAAEGDTAPNHDPRSFRFGIALLPNDYEVIATPRVKVQY